VLNTNELTHISLGIEKMFLENGHMGITNVSMVYNLMIETRACDHSQMS